MTKYFYDEKNETLIAYDPDAGTLHELVHVGDLEEVVEEPQHEQSRQTIASIGKLTAKGERSRRVGCDECGSPSRHKKNCSKARAKTQPSGKNASPRQKAEGRISQMIFGRVKILQSHDVAPENIATNLDIPIAEVERAFDFETYSDYLKG